jgi:hypothetical protein
MNPIEQLMVRRSTFFKLAAAVVALVLVLWATGSSLPSLWITPVIIFALWIAVQLGLKYRHRQPRSHEGTGKTTFASGLTTAVADWGTDAGGDLSKSPGDAREEAVISPRK